MSDIERYLPIVVMLVILVGSAVWVYLDTRPPQRRPEWERLQYYEEVVAEGRLYYKLSRSGAMHPVESSNLKFVLNVHERIVALVYMEDK